MRPNDAIPARVLVVGAGRSGEAVADLLMREGVTVTVSDRRPATEWAVLAGRIGAAVRKITAHPCRPGVASQSIPGRPVIKLDPIAHGKVERLAFAARVRQLAD